MKKYGVIILSLFVLLLGITGCSTSKNEIKNQNNMAVEIVDLDGNKIALKEIPKRIVSLSPTNTELVFSVGSEASLVGVTTYCDYPEAAKNIEKIGDFSGANLEKIVELKPDVVLAGSSTKEDVRTALEALGIPVISTEAKTIEDIYKSITLIGKITDNNSNAENIISKMKSDIANIESKIGSKSPVPVFYVVWREPFKTAGKNTFIDEAITLAGGQNVAGNVDGWADYSREALIESNPYGIIASQHFSTEPQTVESLSKDELFKDLEAVKSGRVYIITDDSKISRGGPRIVEAIEEMRMAIDSWS